MKHVTFIRHGQVPGNELKKYIGITDEELSDEGIKQANKLFKYYNSRAGAYHYPLGTLFVSPMKRCIQTAEIVFPDNEFKVIEEFKETNFGAFEGKSYEDMKDYDAYRKWVEDGCMSQIPNGDNPKDVITRTTDAFVKCMSEIKDGGRACFVVHGGTVRSIVSKLSNQELGFYDIEVNNCEPINMEYKDGRLYSSGNSHKFFQNKDCKYFPCHKIDAEKDFNCMFCYCPLYYMGKECGGNFKYTDKGIKSCIDCNLPHKRESYDYMNKKLASVNRIN